MLRLAFLATLATLSLVAARDSLNFLVVGDWGGQNDSPYYTEGQTSVAAAMANKAQEIDSQFVVGVGDNFYDLGVTDVEDKRFQETFENIFSGESLQTPWYMVCGNHDHHGNASAQVAYSKVSKRWIMPELYYSITPDSPASVGSVQFVMIDTIILAGLTHLEPSLKYLPPVLINKETITQAEDQWAWIEETLHQSTADWLFVAGHYPVWSVASHGPTQVLVDRLKPLLEKYNVSAYFSGHDHDLQHINESNSSVNYFVSGAGHETSHSTKHEDDIPKDSLKFRYGSKHHESKHGGFAAVKITEDTMTVTFFDEDEEQLYSTDMSRRRNLK